jgi:hypothetical protein
MAISHGERAQRRVRIIEKAREGASAASLASTFGLGVPYVYGILRTAGAPIISEQGSVTLTHVEKSARKASLLEDAANNVDLSELRRKYNLAASTIINYCYKAGIHLGGRGIKRKQTVTCSICGDTHTAEQKRTLREVCAKPACRMTFGCARDAAIHERNLEILAQSEGSLTLQTIADKHDITRERVRQIVEEYGGRPLSQKDKVSHCKHCSGEISYVGRLPGKFCSNKCRVASRQAGLGKRRQAHRARALARDAQWSRTIYKNYTCDGCGISFKRSNYLNSITRQSYSPEKLALKRIYCSMDCYAETGLRGATRKKANNMKIQEITTGDHVTVKNIFPQVVCGKIATVVKIDEDRVSVNFEEGSVPKQYEGPCTVPRTCCTKVEKD